VPVRGSGLLQFLQTFWGLAVVIGLGGFSVYHAAHQGNNRATGGRNAAVIDHMTATPSMPAATPIGGFPTPAPLTAFLACKGQDGDAARFYVPAPGGYVVLRADTDDALVRALLAGEPTRFGTRVNVVQTPCLRSLVREGRFP
jgi:hypothetical protein